MANLLERYGIKPDLNKSFSISFIDNFVDCSYRVFLTYFMGLWKKTADIPKVFGSGCHRGLAKVNELMQAHNEVCRKCTRDCKLYSVDKVKAMLVPMEECRIKQLMMEQFLLEFNDEFEELALVTNKSKTAAEVKEILLAHHRYAYNCMCSVMFQSQPVGEVLMTENKLTGTLGEHKILGVVDLVLGIQQENKMPKTLIVDYKTTGIMPPDILPMRQLSLYVHLLEQRNLEINGVSAIYMVKKDPPKVIRKNSKEFQQSKTTFISLDRDRTEYEKALAGIKEDMDQVKDAISCGNFMRNRKSVFCQSCEQKEYCENTYLLDKAVEMGQTKQTQNSEKELEE